MRGNKPFRIVVAEPFAPEAVARLQEIGEVRILDNSAPETLLAALADADALLVRSKAHVTARIIDGAPKLKVVGRASTNVDHIDLKAASKRKISVVYAPNVAVTSTAEFTLALILALHRRILFHDHRLREGDFDALRAPAGREMGHQVLGLLGVDPVSEHLAKMCRAAFGMKVIWHDPFGHSPILEAAGKVDLPKLLAETDILSLHLPMGRETRGFLNAERLVLLKPSAVVVNSSRGALIDTVALAAVLKQQRIAGAALDVFEVEPLPADHPLRKAPNCILTPHVAGATLDAAAERFTVADDVVRVLQGEKPIHPADLPEATR